MKRYLTIILALVMAAALAAPALALTTGARSGSNSGTTEAVVAIPGDSNAHTSVLAVNATSDLAGSYLRVFWSSDGVSTTVDEAASGTTLPVASTTGFDASDIIVVQTPEGLAVKRVVSSVNSGVSLVLDSALPSGYGAVGDAVYKMGDSATDSDAAWAVGAATVEKSTSVGVIVGPRNSPIVLLLDGTSSCSINYATWDYTD